MKNNLFNNSVLFAVFILLSFQTGAQKYKGLAPTPPMGWNSWNHFACNVDEKLIRETADAMVSSGMKDAGYQYVNIDDCWHGTRDSLGFIHPDAERFPSGMKALADYIHAKGLKLGLYSDAGWKTCGGKPGSRGYEYQDALTYASWGVDYLKYDWCNTEGLNAEGAYMTMSRALAAAGRPIVFSLCEWGDNKPWEWGKEIGHLWRTTGDIYNCFDCVVNYGTWNSWGVLQILDMNKELRKHAGPEHWNDPDMMEVGNGMSFSEDRAHFSMWCMLAAPLIAGNDLRKMNKETAEILTNKEVIAVDQDPLGIQGLMSRKLDDLEVWAKPLSNGELAVCFLNRSTTPCEINFDWLKNPISDAVSKCSYDFSKNEYSIRDLWLKKEAGTTNTPLKAVVGGHDVFMVKLTPKNQ
ncbi:MAG: glycoside hydrolase family 27 protein [Bacteroidales bacterium]|nr:glycoside hydrolase family 27 protein [Bacteroidales bacterium]